MTIDRAEMCRRVSVPSLSLQGWIEAGWIHASGGDGVTAFSEMDVARALLIRDLTGPMGVNADGVAVILDLVDQIHGLRQALRGLTLAVAAQDLPVRQRIWAGGARFAGGRGGAARMPAPGRRAHPAE
ncbi:chaperone modulator CbpM [Methylopila sp. Yamaguchi]|uniref:chaperone modulator CbpM n=1 Tax=Methylopila sp. Yamaguchi TaxID=1437817 RepID=UPI000CC0FAB2|nr:chaperone modulator CbpM [Methylopila sp. Yamaguchi]GBD50148.1 hypothetical protein METY_3361 [Methylopila sp. Yamaguchi]